MKFEIDAGIILSVQLRSSLKVGPEDAKETFHHEQADRQGLGQYELFRAGDWVGILWTAKEGSQMANGLKRHCKMVPPDRIDHCVPLITEKTKK